MLQCDFNKAAKFAAYFQKKTFPKNTPGWLLLLFHAAGLFLFSLKTSVNILFLMLSESMERDQWHKTG